MLQVKSESQIMTSMLSETLDVVREIRAKLVETAPSTSTNKASDAIALKCAMSDYLLEHYIPSEKAVSKIVDGLYAVIAQQHT